MSEYRVDFLQEGQFWSLKYRIASYFRDTKFSQIAQTKDRGSNDHTSTVERSFNTKSKSRFPNFRGTLKFLRFEVNSRKSGNIVPRKEPANRYFYYGY